MLLPLTSCARNPKNQKQQQLRFNRIEYNRIVSHSLSFSLPYKIFLAADESKPRKLVYQMTRQSTTLDIFHWVSLWLAPVLFVLVSLLYFS